MKSQENLGTIYVPNIAKYAPFTVKYSEVDNDTIQVDLIGAGCISYFDKLDSEIELEINTNINNHLKEYAELTGHNAAEIGYSLNLNQSKKLNRKYNTFETSLEASIVFNKPVIGVPAKSLEPTIEFLSSIILSEIFILNENGIV